LAFWNLSFQFSTTNIPIFKPVAAYKWLIINTIQGKLWKFYKYTLSTSSYWCYKHRRTFLCLGELTMFPLIIFWSGWVYIIAYWYQKDYGLTFGSIPIVVFLIWVAKSIITQSWQEHKHYSEEPVLKLISIRPILLQKYGMKIEILAEKPTDFTVEQAKVYFPNEDFWQALAKIVGTTILTAFKWMFYPLTLSPRFMNVDCIKAGSDKVNAEIRFATEDQGFLKINQKWVLLPRLKRLAEMGCYLELLVEYGKQSGWDWVPEGVLLRYKCKMSEFIDALENKKDLVVEVESSKDFL